MIETHLDERRQTVKLGLIKVIPELFSGESFKAVFSIGKGVYCELENSVISTREVEKLSARMLEWENSGDNIQLLFKKDYYYYRVGDVIVKTIHPAAVDPSNVAPYRLIPFSNGFIVDFDYDRTDPRKSYILPLKMSESYRETHEWLKELKLEHSFEVNTHIAKSIGNDLLDTGEAIHEKKISMIADMIKDQRRALRVVLISGPSASGKTSFTQRLFTHLKVNGLKPVLLALDEYFLKREHLPLDEQGAYDFDNIKALDLSLLQAHVKALIDCQSVETPVYDFVTGQRSNITNSMSLDPDQILIISGIHALNPALLEIKSRSMLFKIYLSSLYGINIDSMNRVPATDARLIRRMVRGNLFRGVDPEKTFAMWPSIRKGEEKYVFQFQEDCDIMFNSSLVYELNALRPFAEEALQKVPDNSVHYPTKKRLLDLLSFFDPLDPSKIPFNSVLREFIGGSSYAPEEKIKIY